MSGAAHGHGRLAPVIADHREGVGVSVGDAQIKTLATTTKKLALQAEMTLCKGLQLKEQVLPTQRRDAVKAFGELQQDLVNFVLDITKIREHF